MKCPKCQFENPDGSIFCRECGSKLESICPSCQSTNPPDYQFCGECGYNLQSTIKDKQEEHPKEKLTPISSSDSERKYVTVLFSDMSGYTAMTEKLDPEEAKMNNLITDHFPKKDFHAKVQEFADRMSKRIPIAVKEIKRTVHEGMETTLRQCLSIEMGGPSESSIINTPRMRCRNTRRY